MAPKRKAPSEGASASRPARKELPLFSGCRLVFWAAKLTSHMQQRVKQLNGLLQQQLAADTTHIICPPDLTAKQAEAKLGGWTGPSIEAYVGPGMALRLPKGVAFVTPDWVSRTIAKQELQPVEQFLPPGLAPAPPQPSVKIADSQDSGDNWEQQQRQQQAAAEQQPAGGAGAAQLQDTAAAMEQDRVDSTATLPFSAQQLWAAQQGPASSGQHQDVQQDPGFPPQGPAPCHVVRHGSEFVAVQGAKPLYTGGDTGIPWGSYGVWEEPYDPAAARETVDKLRIYWFHTHMDGQDAAPTSPQPPKSTQVNDICSHVCCSRRPYCLVHGLDGFKKEVYVEGRDQFQIKAIDKAVQSLIMWNEPLDKDADVDRVPGVGPKAKLKVKELLISGTSQRFAAAAADEQRQVINMFLEVWGTGSATATRWYSLGCRTLDDLRSRQDLNLTETQRVGLKYVDDLKHKIPRTEIAQAEATVRQACFELVEQWGGAEDVERTYCFATGSYKRGKPQSSDIDILICLPPSLGNANCQGFLRELFKLLLQRGLLLDELNPSRTPHEPSYSRASWMGLCRPSGAPHSRRIDLKVYSNAATPYAVNYFANSQSFCRSTRYWANNAVTERARRYNPAATGFKLSDSSFTPIARTRRRHSRAGHSRGVVGSSESEEEGGGANGGTTVLGPELHCPDETSIFRELGLAYVPVHMRYFHDYF